MKPKIIAYLAAFLLFGSNLQAQVDSPPVKQLKELYQTDKKFQQTIKGMFDNLQDMPDGTQNPWKNRDFDDLTTFLNEWFYFLPLAHDGLDRIIEFSMLYYHNPAGLKFVLEEPGLSWTNYFVEERGKFMDSPASAKIISQWMSDPSIPNDDFVLPIEGFNSFNEFFIRELKPGVRPVDAVTDNSVLVSPADGIINMINNDLQLNTAIPTKGKMTLSLNNLLDNSSYAKKFVGGTALAVFLMPDNYHHFHAPISGTVVASNQLVGDRLFGMPDIPDMINNGNVAYNKDYSVFENFRHGYFIIKTEAYGNIAMIPIGLQTVGSVVFEEDFKKVAPGSPVSVYKGQKMGHFAYGGSTVLLLFEKDRLSSLTVRQGQGIGRLKKSQ